MSAGTTVEKYGAVVTAVDVPQKVVEFTTKAANTRRLTLATYPDTFTWPQVGDQIMVRYENGQWSLDGWFDTAGVYQEVNPGDAVIKAPTGTVHVVGSPSGHNDFSFNKTSFGGGSGTGGGIVVSRAYRNAAYTLPTGAAWNKVPLDTANNDPGGLFSAANGRITIPAAGTYQVEGQVQVNGAPLAVAAIYKNGQQVSFGTADGTGTGDSSDLRVVVSDTIACNAGDYLELWVYSSISTNLNITAGFPNACNYLSVVGVASLPSMAATTTVARAYRSGGLTLTAGTWTLFPLDTKDFDPGGCFNTATHLYTCPATGYYQVNGSVFPLTSTAGDGVIAGISHNGGLPSVRGDIGAAVPTALGAEAAGVSDIIYCNVGDTLGLAYYIAQADGVQLGTAGSYMSVVQVGATTLATSLPPLVWTPLPYNTTNWTDYGFGFQVGQYAKDALGFVHVRGLLKSVTGYGFGTLSTLIIAQLPLGFRPAQNEMFDALQVDSANNRSLERVDINTAGQLIVNGSAGAGFDVVSTGGSNNGSAAYLSLKHMTFQAA